MPVTLLTRPAMPSAGRYELKGEYSIDVLNAAKDPYRAVNSAPGAEMDFAFPYPYQEKTVPEELKKFVEDTAAKYPEILENGCGIKIEKVGVRRLTREVPREDRNILELGTTQDASQEEYAKAAEFFEKFFERESREVRKMGFEEGLYVEVYHLENRYFENDRYYPITILSADSAGRKGVEFVATWIRDILSKVLPWQTESQFSAMPWGLKGVETRVVKGRFKGKEFERLTVFVVVEQQTFYDWKKAEEQFMEGVEGIGDFQDMEDAEVWLEWVTGMKENATT